MMDEDKRSDCCDAACYIEPIDWQHERRTCSCCGSWAVRHPSERQPSIGGDERND